MRLSGERLRAGYDGGDVLRGVSVGVGEGEIAGVIGRNGVGKTTLIRTLIGQVKARGGSVRFDGRDVTGCSPEDRARLGLGLVPQGRGIFPNMSVADNLRAGRLIGGGVRELRTELVYDYFPFLRKRKRQLAGTLSGGEQEMLAIGRALIAGPKVLLLDEPSDGVQPSFVQQIGESLVQLNAETGLSILLVEQNVELMQRMARRAYVLDKGEVVATLDAEEIESDEVVEGYLAL